MYVEEVKFDLEQIKLTFGRFYLHILIRLAVKSLNTKCKMYCLARRESVLGIQIHNELLI